MSLTLRSHGRPVDPASDGGPTSYRLDIDDRFGGDVRGRWSGHLTVEL
jgi:hypothetical protein